MGRQPGFDGCMRAGQRARGREPGMPAGAGGHPVAGLAAAKEIAPQCACANGAPLAQCEVAPGAKLEAIPAPVRQPGKEAQCSRAMLAAGDASTSAPPLICLGAFQWSRSGPAVPAWQRTTLSRTGFQVHTHSYDLDTPLEGRRGFADTRFSGLTGLSRGPQGTAPLGRQKRISAIWWANTQAEPPTTARKQLSVGQQA